MPLSLAQKVAYEENERRRKWRLTYSADYDASLFGPSDDGFLFNFSKYRLFQDVVGTIPVAAGADPIALALDGHSWGGKTLTQVLAAQPEICTGGDFSASTGWTLASGSTISGSKLNISTAVSGLNYFTVSTQPAGVYQISFTVDAASAGNVILRLYTAAGVHVSNTSTFYTSPGTYTMLATANASFERITVQSGGSGFTGTIDNVSCKRVPGNHGLQATTSARPFWKTPNFARLDGADDNLPTTFNTAPSMSYVLKAKPTNVGVVAIGTNPAVSQYAYMGVNASGKLSAGVGTTAAFGHASNQTWQNTLGVAALTFDGSTVNLYWNGANVYSAPQVGSVSAALAVPIGCYNGNGSFSAFTAGDFYNALAINRALTLAEIINLTNSWGTT